MSPTTFTSHTHPHMCLHVPLIFGHQVQPILLLFYKLFLIYFLLTFFLFYISSLFAHFALHFITYLYQYLLPSACVETLLGLPAHFFQTALFCFPSPQIQFLSNFSQNLMSHFSSSNVLLLIYINIFPDNSNGFLPYSLAYAKLPVNIVKAVNMPSNMFSKFIKTKLINLHITHFSS